MIFEAIFNTNLLNIFCPRQQAQQVCFSSNVGKFDPYIVDDDDNCSISSETVSSSTILDDDESSLDDVLSLQDDSSKDFSSSMMTYSQQAYWGNLSLPDLEDCLQEMQAEVGNDHPLTAQLWNAVGLRYYSDDDITTAMHCFRQAILACPSPAYPAAAHAYYYMGICCCHNGREAFDLFLLAAESFEFLAAYEERDRTAELAMIDAKVSEILAR